MQANSSNILSHKSPTAMAMAPVATAMIAVFAMFTVGCGKSESLPATNTSTATVAAAKKADAHDEDEHKDDAHKKDGQKEVGHGNEKHAGESKGGSGETGHAADQGIKLTDAEMKAVGIQSESVQEAPVADQMLVTATIRANQDRMARIAPRVPGRLLNVSANLGDRVRAGQSLATLDSLEVGEARSQHAQLETEARLMAANLERAERLQSEQIIPQKDVLRARAEHEKARAGLRAAENKLKMLGLSPSADGAGMALFSVTAPFAGTIIEKKAVLGDLAQPDAALFVVADLSTLWIEANLHEKDLGRILPGSEAEVMVEAYPGVRFRGRLSHIGSVMDPETRTIRGRIEVKNADGRLKPEMFATAAIKTTGLIRAMVLPDEAVTLVSGVANVFVEEHGGFEARKVELGERMKGRVVVKSGIKPGERVVTRGTYALKARLLKSQIGAGHAH